MYHFHWNLQFSLIKTHLTLRFHLFFGFCIFACTYSEEYRGISGFCDDKNFWKHKFLTFAAKNSRFRRPKQVKIHVIFSLIMAPVCKTTARKSHWYSYASMQKWWDQIAGTQPLLGYTLHRSILPCPPPPRDHCWTTHAAHFPLVRAKKATVRRRFAIYALYI